MPVRPNFMLSVTLILLVYLQFLMAKACSNQGRRCPDIPVEPVCGSDLKTYGNQCKLRRELCGEHEPILLSRGICKKCDNPEMIHTLFIRNFFYGNGTCSIFGNATNRSIRKCVKRIFVVSLKTKYPLYMRAKEFVEAFPTTSQSKRMKKCVKKMHETCDENKDFVLSKKELFSCVIEETYSGKVSEISQQISDEKKSRDNEAHKNTICVSNICYCSDEQGNIIIHFPLSKKNYYNCTLIVSKWNIRSSLKTTPRPVQTSVSPIVSSYCDESIIKHNYAVNMSLQYFYTEKPINFATADLLSMRVINKIILWKFRRLDKNRDNLLDTEEQVKAFKELQENMHTDINCWRTTLGRCDQDKNLLLSRREWRHCFGYKQIGGNPTLEDISAKDTTEETVCQPVTSCTLTCAAGFVRDNYGCLVCRCKDFSKYLADWRRSWQ